MNLLSKANYVCTALQGTMAAAVILHRAGYPVWDWEEQALLRTHEMLYNVINYSASSDDAWVPWVVDCFYAKNFAAGAATDGGKTVDFTDWTHSPGNPWCK